MVLSEYGEDSNKCSEGFCSVLQLLATAMVLFSLLIVFALKMEAMFFRNVGSYKNHMATHPRRWHSSFLCSLRVILLSRFHRDI
jgi:hypothetical protein